MILQTKLLEPPGFSTSLRSNFVMMFREEWRQNVDFAKKRHIMMFPVMLALVSMVVTVGLRFLTGDAGIESAYDTMKAADAQSAKAFTWDELKVGLHLSLFMFSLGMGSFAFVGRNMVSQRASGKSYLLASPALLPLELPPVYLAYYLKEVAFYLCLILTPVVGGMALGILFGTYTGISVPLLWSSIPVVLSCMLVTMMQGLALSFYASAIWSRSRFGSFLIPIIAVIAGVIVALDYVPLESAISGLHVQLHHDFFLLPISAIAWLIIATVGAYLVPDDFEVRVTTRTDLFVPVHERLFFLGNGQMRTLVAKEIADVWRSGTMFKMLGSYCVPLLFLLALAWMADFATNGDMPIPINLLSYAPFLGFFGFNFYSWLNAVDSPDFLNGLPVRVPQLLRAKIIVYFLMTTWISVLFLILMAHLLDQWVGLLPALLVMFANSVYIVALSGLLMGLRPNKAIFDTQIMAIFWVATVLPLVSLFLLSFTQGDMSLYANQFDQIQAGGFDAESSIYTDEAEVSFQGIVAISVGLLVLAGAFLMMLERRWGRSAFEN
ncbi:MAG: hypothetical protein CMA73_02270 [Euryarchaeota archaeon]|nr:hypothetical protein [Euryarchaeota archaeon]MCH2641905.1 hypothetical protein [Candidatus Thalassarchaeum sp.]GIS44162.1 MAG: hypothetical protein Ct9H90mP16_12320 [Candidatus Poseidoniales archaeon]|tara:strand:+ start:702 stop:2351 length:1650 start_codon:yes stop_codon:yes gene_type:complete